MVGPGTTQIYSSGLTATQIQGLLFAQGPVMVGVMGSDFGFQHYSSGVYSGCPVDITINHAVLLYGYDSNGNWLIKNQWGTSWGESGFMVLSPTNDCGMSTLLGNLEYSSINSDPNVVITDTSLLFSNPSS